MENDILAGVELTRKFRCRRLRSSQHDPIFNVWNDIRATLFGDAEYDLRLVFIAGNGVPLKLDAL